MIRMFFVCCLFTLLSGSGAVAQEILDAARGGDLARVRALVEADSGQMEVKSVSNKTPLIFAAQGGHLEVVAYLIGMGADLNARNAANETSLIYAVYFGHADVVEYLLDHGADPNITSSGGDTALDLAVMHESERIIGLLAAKGAVETRIPAPEVLSLTGRIHKIAFSYGEAPNILACAGRDGLLLVDTGWLRTLPGLRKELGKIDDREIVAIINTHEHPDHIEGNAIAGEKTLIISLPHLDELVVGGVVRPGEGPLSGRSGMSFDRYYTFDFGGEEIRLIPASGAHTDADMIVHFTGSNVVDLGDLLILQSFPSVTEAVDEYLEILAKVIDVFTEDAILVCGHGKSGTTRDVTRYRQMLIAVREMVTDRIKEGQSREEILKDPARAEYAAFGTFIPILNVDYWIEAICGSRRSGQ